MAFYGGRGPGGRWRFGFAPGCLVFSLLASVVLTVLLNLLIRAV